MQRHLRVSISDHNTLLETNSWGKATGWKRVDCFTLRRIVLGCTVPIFSHSGIPTALNRLWMYYPCYPLTLVPPGLLSEDAQLPAQTAASSRLPSTWSRAQPQLSSAHQPEPPNSLPWGARCSVYLKVTVPPHRARELTAIPGAEFCKKVTKLREWAMIVGGSDHAKLSACPCAYRELCIRQSDIHRKTDPELRACSVNQNWYHLGTS